MTDYDRAKEWLDECAADIDDFLDKCSPGGFLRTATLSHLQHLFKIGSQEAEEILTEYLEEQCTKPGS